MGLISGLTTIKIELVLGFSQAGICSRSGKSGEQFGGQTALASLGKQKERARSAMLREVMGPYPTYATRRCIFLDFLRRSITNHDAGILFFF